MSRALKNKIIITLCISLLLPNFAGALTMKEVLQGYDDPKTVLTNNQTTTNNQGKVLGVNTEVVTSNVQITNITLTSAVVTWNTNVPATSQVILLEGNLQPLIRYPEPKDSSLVTNHSVSMSGLNPGTKYTFYVASQDAAGNFGVSQDLVAGSANLSTFTTTSINASATLNFRADISGPKNVYAGSDLYFLINPILLAGSYPEYWTVKYIDGLNNGVTYQSICAANYDVNNDAAWAWGENCYVQNSFGGRFRVPAGAAPGQYSANLTLSASGVLKNFSYSFNVLPIPGAITKASISNFPPIPNIGYWEEGMTVLANKWCDGKVYGFGWMADVWYYDGARVYFQVGDYLNKPGTYKPCAMNVLNQYRDYVNTNNGQIVAYKKFPHGLAMHYWRTGDEASKTAVMNLYTATNNWGMNGAASKYGAGGDPQLIRELAYGINSLIMGERVGMPKSEYLPIMIDEALGYIDQLFVSNIYQFNQPFFDGLLAEALIEYYEDYKDPRVPAAIKNMLDGLWQYSWNDQAGLTYNLLWTPPYYENTLVHLVAPAYAWYWQLTGDNTYLQRGDALFAKAISNDSWSGKMFSQNYRWSFDYVRWRSGNPVSTLAKAANPLGDLNAPIISSVNSSGLGGTSATISWQTNEVSTTQIEYGTTNSYGNSSLLDTVKVTSHSVMLNGLLPNTTYNYRVKSGDNDANLGVSQNFTFTTGAFNLSNWSYRKTATVPKAKVTGSLTDFPVLFSVTDVDLKSVANGGKVANSSGGDILFISTSGTRLAHEIEKYDPATGSLLAWVKVPTLTSAADASFFIYFGNYSTSDEQDAKNVWGNNYKAVWHLGQSSGTVVNDSSSNINNGTKVSATKPTYSQNGKIAGVLDFDGNTEGVVVDNNIGFDANASFSLSAWVNADTLNNTKIILEKISNTSPGCNNFALYNVGGIPSFTMGNQGCAQIWTSSNAAITTGTWNYLVGVRDVAANKTYLYLNGNLVGSGTNALTGGDFNFAGKVKLGSNLNFNYNYFDGKMDEPRIVSSARSAEWVKTEYNNQNSPDGFVVLTSLQILSPLTPPVFTPTPTPTPTPSITPTPFVTPTPTPIPTVDTAAPVISAITTSSITNTTATISWTTNEASDSQIEYGLSSSYGVLSPIDSTLSINHTVNFSNLTPGITYYYRVKSKDASGNVAISAGQSFVTTGSSVTPTPTPTVTPTPANPPAGGTGNWYSSSWLNKKTITINKAQVQGTLTNFPVLVSLTDPELKSTSNSGKVASAQGNDFVFTTSTNTKLSHEIEKYDPSTGQLIAWVKVPSISSANDTTLNLYFGNSSAQDMQDKVNVWDSNYKAVYHFKNTNSIDVTDSTSNVNNGTVNGSVTATTGQVGAAANFSGPSYINASTINVSGGSVTMETWASLSSLTSYWGGLIAQGSNSDFAMGYDGLNSLGFILTGGNGIQVRYNNGFSNNTMYHVVGTITGTTGKIYVNGVEVSSGTVAAVSNGGSALTLGTGASGLLNMTGVMDEARVSNIARSSDYIKTEYNNQSNPSSFISVSSASAYTPPVTPTPTPTPGVTPTPTPTPTPVVPTIPVVTFQNKPETTPTTPTPIQTFQNSSNYIPLKLINQNGTYYVIKDGQRLGITNPGMLFSYGLEFKDASIPTTAEALLPEGPILSPGDGALVKSPTNPTVYLISLGKKHGFNSENTFNTLGFSFTKVLTVTAPELDKMPLGEVLTDPKLPHKPGTDININGTIYYIDSNNKRLGYPTETVWNSWHFDNDFSNVVIANTADLSLPVGEIVLLRKIE